VEYNNTIGKDGVHDMDEEAGGKQPCPRGWDRGSRLGELGCVRIGGEYCLVRTWLITEVLIFAIALCMQSKVKEFRVWCIGKPESKSGAIRDWCLGQD